MTFDPVKRGRRAAEGVFQVHPAKRSVFCERDDAAERTVPAEGGKWKVRTIRGNRVMELIPNDAVAAADFRLRYNDTAAAAVKAASDKALEAKQYWEASSKKVILK